MKLPSFATGDTWYILVADRIVESDSKSQRGKRQLKGILRRRKRPEGLHWNMYAPYSSVPFHLFCNYYSFIIYEHECHLYVCLYLSSFYLLCLPCICQRWRQRKKDNSSLSMNIHARKLSGLNYWRLWHKRIAAMNLSSRNILCNSLTNQGMVMGLAGNHRQMNALPQYGCKHFLSHPDKNILSNGLEWSGKV